MELAAIRINPSKEWRPRKDFAPDDIAINKEFRVYTGKSDWAYRDVATLLWAWFNIFNEAFVSDFGGPLPEPHLKFERLRKRLGQYRYNRNASGVRFEITVATNHLVGTVDVRRLLVTWLHELLHEWQELRGKPGKNNYHNEAYRDMSLQLGIPSNHRGQTISIPESGRFNELLRKHGLPVLTIECPPQPVSECRMDKWFCGCTVVRCATELDAHCTKCGHKFVRA